MGGRRKGWCAVRRQEAARRARVRRQVRDLAGRVEGIEYLLAGKQPAPTQVLEGPLGAAARRAEEERYAPTPGYRD